MSTSLLYHAFNIVGYQQVSEKFEGGHVTFRIEQQRDRLRCPVCRSEDVWVRGHKERTFRTVPIGPKPAWMTFRREIASGILTLSLLGLGCRNAPSFEMPLR